MLLFRSWKESLLLFLPKNYKLFLLVTLKATLQLYKDLFRYCWWFIALAMGLFIAAPVVGLIAEGLPEQASMIAVFLGVAIFVLEFIWTFLQVIFARPSTDRKGWRYLGAMFKRTFVGSAVVALLSVALFFPLLFLHPVMLNKVLFLFNGAYGLSLIALFFYMDGDHGIKGIFESVWQALLHIAYNMPFILVSVLGILLLNDAFSILFFKMMPGKWIAVLFPLLRAVKFILMPVVTAYFKQFYVKRLHDQFQLYFPKA